MKRYAFIIYASVFMVAISGAIFSKANANKKTFSILAYRTTNCQNEVTKDCQTTDAGNGACTHVFVTLPETVYGRIGATSTCNVTLYKSNP